MRVQEGDEPVRTQVTCCTTTHCNRFGKWYDRNSSSILPVAVSLTMAVILATATLL